MAEIVINEKGQKVVEIDTIIFSGKRKIDWDGVKQYLKKYVGESYQIDETDDLVYIGSDFPDEYAHSKYNNRALGTVGKAKANASQVIPELIKIATDISFSENFEQKHSHDAKYGWYYFASFALPCRLQMTKKKSSEETISGAGWLFGAIRMEKNICMIS